MAQQRLTRELVETAVAEYRYTTEQAANAYQCGRITEDDGCRVVGNAFYAAFWELLKRSRLKFALNSTNFEQCKKEFALFPAGSDLSGAEHVPWLFDVKSNREEASKEDQRLVFLLMKQLDVSPSFFEPIPDSVIKPKKTYCHTYRSASAINIPFECIDDGGLLSDFNPLGKTFTLVNTLGLKAEVTIKEDRRNENREGMDFDEMVYSTERGLCVIKAEFLAEGSIEGYTAKERSDQREILIRLKNQDKINSLAYWESPEDYRAFSDHPLWQEYISAENKQWHRSREYDCKVLKTPVKSQAPNE